MKKILDKFKLKIKIDKRILIFFITLIIVGLVMGIVLASVLSENDKLLVGQHLNDFIKIVESNELDKLTTLKNNVLTTLLYVIGIWLLGISVIGIPIIIGMFFVKCFIIGFSIGSIFISFGFKGSLFALFYAFPSSILTIISLLVLSVYAISFSTFLIYSILNKKTIDFKIMINKYLIVLAVNLGICLLMAVYDTYIMPLLIQNFYI